MEKGSDDLLNLQANHALDFPTPPPLDSSHDYLSFADVIQFADFGPQLGLARTELPKVVEELGEDEEEESYLGQFPVEVKGNKRKRARTVKTSEEVENQRMTHIAVERNRRKHMNEHLRVLRSLMPASYVQRGDQASIIGGAIEFVRELEQLLQCLESQKRRRMYGGDAPAPMSVVAQPLPQLPPFLAEDPSKHLLTVPEDIVHNKSCVADVEVRVSGTVAVLKVLSRRRPGQLLRVTAALEEMQLDILHANITTVEQTVLYSFNVKVTSETTFTAEDIATSVQQIFTFIDACTVEAI